MPRQSSNRANALSLLREFRSSEPPIDVKLIALGMDFKVSYSLLDDSTDSHLRIEGGKKLIIVNQNHHINKQRFSIAHEIGHFVNGHVDLGDYSTNSPGFDYHNPQDRQCKEANSFAAELLMPKHLLEKDIIKTGVDTPKLAELYQVSQAAMRVRLGVLRFTEKYSHIQTSP